MFATRPLLGLGSIALGVAGFQAPAHAGNFSIGFNLNLGPSRPAVVVPAAPIQPAYYAPARPIVARPMVPAPVIQPAYYSPSYYGPSYRQPTPQCNLPAHHHHHQHNGPRQSDWRYSNYPYGRR